MHTKTDRALGAETKKVLNRVVPGFDRLVAAAGLPIAFRRQTDLALALRPALLAGIAMVERSGTPSSTEKPISPAGYPS